MNRTCTKLTLSAALSFSAAALAGCHNNQPRGPIEPNAQPYNTNKQIYVDGYDLAHQINVDQPPTMTKDAAGILHIAVPVRSVIDRPFTLQYRVTFLDRNRQTVNQQSWADLPMNPNTPEQIDANSSAPADDFRVDLRLPAGYDR